MDEADETYAEGDWEALVTAALLGTERRGGTPEALLDAAAVQTLRRRAGLRPAPAARAPQPAPRDPRPAPPEAARGRLGHRLGGPACGGGAGGGGGPPGRTVVLPHWVGAAG
ncbi:hypothetical protein ACFVXK_36815, partial [Streptomyces sp. NPDC058157]